MRELKALQSSYLPFLSYLEQDPSRSTFSNNRNDKFFIPSPQFFLTIRSPQLCAVLMTNLPYMTPHQSRTPIIFFQSNVLSRFLTMKRFGSTSSAPLRKIWFLMRFPQALLAKSHCSSSGANTVPIKIYPSISGGERINSTSTSSSLLLREKMIQGMEERQLVERGRF